MNLFYSPCSPTQSNNSKLNYIHPDRGQETHTHSKTWPSYTHPSLCVFVCVNLCASLGRTVSPELLHWHIFSSIHYPHRQTRPAERVCVCVWRQRGRALRAERAERWALVVIKHMLAVNWMRNKDIAMIHLHYFSSPLLHLHPDLFQQVTWYSTLSLSLFLSSCLALMVVLWCYGWSLHPHEERESTGFHAEWLPFKGVLETVLLSLKMNHHHLTHSNRDV